LLTVRTFLVIVCSILRRFDQERSLSGVLGSWWWSSTNR